MNARKEASGFGVRIIALIISDVDTGIRGGIDW